MSESRAHQGLSAQEALARLRQDGPNELLREGATAWPKLLLRQLSSAMVLLLAAAGLVSLALGEKADAIAIGVILALNAAVGFFQEHRAERAILALRSMTSPRARVIRDGHLVVVPASELVKGDLLSLEAGDVVGADARLIEASKLSAVEAALTGESMPSRKSVDPVPDDAPLAERHDRVYLGTSVATGTGVAEVVATGMGTEMGRIARLLQSVEREVTPLQSGMASVGRVLALACLAIVLAVAALGWMRGTPTDELLLTSISLAVAAVPEGLPAIVTIALAIGVMRLASRNVLVRRLSSVETLGCTTVICTDKTGTLTTGVMVVRDTWGADRRALLEAAAACCDAELGDDGATGVGDPTEIAILAAAAERGIHRADIERELPRTETWPFEPETRRMAVMRSDGIVRVKGAPEVVVASCTSGTEGAQQAQEDMASRGLRVLAVATGTSRDLDGLRLLGLVGIADPPRGNAIQAVAQARRAGIRTVMITGDHPATAQAIAREMGILMPGEDPRGIVHARATPEDKIRTVQEWKSRGDIVAMTGDGVNDAPALREAHVGIAMGRTGTEVTREASDMVLADDDFASIVAGVREGRGVWENIQKTLVYLLTGNAGELAAMLGAVLIGLPLPLLPLQLLWINLVTDGLPALALVMDPAEPDLLERKPRAPNTPMLGRRQWTTILLLGLFDALLVLLVFAWALPRGTEGEARALAFTTLVYIEVFRALAARSRVKLYWETGVLSNLKLVAVVLATAGLQAVLHEIPLAADLLGLEGISWSDITLAAAIGLIPVSCIEIAKLVMRWRRKEI